MIIPPASHNAFSQAQCGPPARLSKWSHERKRPLLGRPQFLQAVDRRLTVVDNGYDSDFITARRADSGVLSRPFHVWLRPFENMSDAGFSAHRHDGLGIDQVNGYIPVA